MSRPVFSFRPNLNNPEHKRAWETFQRVPQGQKNGFLVAAILKQQESDYLERIVRSAVQEALKGGEVTPQVVTMEQEIPHEMLDFLSQMG